MARPCPVCGAINRDTARFCQGCGRPLVSEIACPQCGTLNQPNARFCHQCAAFLVAGGSIANPNTGLLPAGSLLANRYIIIHKIGQGGMGAVYKATDTRLGQKVVAVKELSEANLTDPAEKQQARQAFEQEARILAQLNHPNLPRVTDHFSEAGKQYLVMDFIEGQTLQQMLDATGGPLDVQKVSDWAVQLCDVLEYLHSQQPPVVFRDLKPGNIMLDRDGKVKLIDFGIARHFKPGKTTDTVSFGTAGYAPPEQYGKGQTDARSDIYALGATLHHLLTGRDPANNPFNFPPLRTLNPKVPEIIEHAVMKALEQAPPNRWQSAHEMKKALTTASPPDKEAIAAASSPVQAPYAVVPSAASVAVLPGSPRAVSPVRVASIQRVGYSSWLLLAIVLFVVQRQVVMYLSTSGLVTKPYWLPLASALNALLPTLLLVLTRRPGSAILMFGLAIVERYLLHGIPPDSMMLMTQLSGAIAMEIMFATRRYNDFRWWVVSLAALVANLAEWIAPQVMTGIPFEALRVGEVEATQWAGAAAGGLVSIWLGRILASFPVRWKTNQQLTYLQVLLIAVTALLFVRWWSPLINRAIQTTPSIPLKLAVGAAYSGIVLPLLFRIAGKPGTALITAACSTLLTAWTGATVNDILLVRVFGTALAVETVFLVGSYRNFGLWRMIIAAMMGSIAAQYAANVYRGLPLSFSEASYYQLGGAAVGGFLAYVIARLLKR